MATTMGSIDLKSLQGLRDDLTQYFWFESNSSATYGAGVHITLSPESSFISSPTGQNILMNTDGISIRNGVLPMMVLDNDSLDFNVVDTTNSTYTNVASFGASGATIGATATAHSVIDADGQRFYASNGTTQLANIGYGEGASSSGTAIAPYYTFGTRASASSIGNYSTAEGIGVTASGYGSHAEGLTTVASNMYAHAEGANTHAEAQKTHAEGNSTYARTECAHAEGTGTYADGLGAHSEGNGTHAEGYASHAENYITYATGYASHAEGWGTQAGGGQSHAQGYYTNAGYDNQTAIGKFNDNKSNSAFEIGNGTADNARSNAFTVDWAGNVNIASGAQYKINGTGIVDYVVAQGTSGNWIYRKWSSKRYEAWYDSGQTTITTTTSSGNGWYRNSSEYTINMPTGLGFSTVRYANISVNTSYANVITSITQGNTTKLGYYVSHLGSLSSVTAYVSAYVEGGWA